MSDFCTQFVCNVGDPWWLLEAALSAASSGKTKLNCARIDERHYRRIDKLNGKSWK